MNHSDKHNKEPGAAPGGHLPSHVTPEFWQDLIQESQNFLSGLDSRVSQVWHHATHVTNHSRDDPGYQTIATRDFRLFNRSQEVRRQIYEGCRRALLSDIEHGSSSQPFKGRRLNGQDDEDMIAASYGAYAAHVLGDDMRTDAGEKLNTKMYRDFIFAVDKRYKLFKRLPPDNTRVYWDVILGCWAFARDSFCVSFFPCPWIQDDVLKWQPIFTSDIEPRGLYSGDNGILADSRICQLFIRGVLVIVPTDKVDRHGCTVYRVRVMDPDYPHLGDLIYGQAPVIDPADIGEADSKGKGRQSPPPADLEKVSFRDLDNRRLVFHTASSTHRPSHPLLFWHFATAMVKILWQIHPGDYSSKLPSLRRLWADIWPTSHKGDYLTLGPTLALSHLLNNPPTTTTTNKPPPPPTSAIPNTILSLGCTPFASLPPSLIDDKIHYSPLLLLCNEILEQTPHPSDAPRAFTVNLTELQEDEDEAAGIVSRPWHRCEDCSAFERITLEDTRRRGGDVNTVEFVHHHVRSTMGGEVDSEEEDEIESPPPEALEEWKWDHSELLGEEGPGEIHKFCRPGRGGDDFEDCGACRRRVEYVRLKRGVSGGEIVVNHHMRSRRGDGEDSILKLGSMNLG